MINQSKKACHVIHLIDIIIINININIQEDIGTNDVQVRDPKTAQEAVHYLGHLVIQNRQRKDDVQDQNHDQNHGQEVHQEVHQEVYPKDIDSKLFL